MTDRLRELLDPMPIDGETKRAVRLLRIIKKRPVGVIEKGLIEVAVRYKTNDRLALVRETILECAKVMCDLCKNGKPFDPEYPTYHVHFVGPDGIPEWRILCQAQPILALLAEKGTDNE